MLIMSWAVAIGVTVAIIIALIAAIYYSATAILDDFFRR